MHTFRTHESTLVYLYTLLVMANYSQGPDLQKKLMTYFQRPSVRPQPSILSVVMSSVVTNTLFEPTLLVATERMDGCGWSLEVRHLNGTTYNTCT